MIPSQIALAFVLLTGACGFDGPPGAPEQPSEVPATASVLPAEPFPVVPSPTTAGTTILSPTLTGPSREIPSPQVPAGSHIALYKIVQAGDYYALSVAATGQAEYTRHSRTYDILVRKKGNLDPEQVNGLFAELHDLGFFEMEDHYLPARPGEGTPEIKREEVYYWISALDGRPKKTILANEYVAPAELQQLIRILLDVGSALPDGSDEGAFLSAVGYQVLPYLRREEGMASLVLDQETRASYPLLELAVHQPCSLVSFEEQPGLDPEALFPSGTHMMEVMLSDERSLILLLQR
jgi:hypothetical protein